MRAAIAKTTAEEVDFVRIRRTEKPVCGKGRFCYRINKIDTLKRAYM